jgi:hypothetical protein
MISPNRTFAFSCAFWQLLFRIFTHIVSLALLFMARLAEVCISPTKPLCDTTTKFTLKFDKIFAMLRTILYWNIAASWTYKFFRLEISASILRLIHGRYTVFSSTKIRLFTFEAHKVSINDTCVFLWLLKVRGFFIF